MATAVASGGRSWDWRGSGSLGASGGGRLLDSSLPPLHAAAAASLRPSMSAPSLGPDGRVVANPASLRLKLGTLAGPSPLAARQSAVVLAQISRHTALGSSRLLAPPCDEIVRALSPELRPDAAELLARTRRGRHRGDHCEAFLAMLLFEDRATGGGSGPDGAPPIASPLKAAAASRGGDGCEEQGALASEPLAQKIPLRSRRADVDVGAWVESLEWSFGTQTAPRVLHRRPSKMLAMATDPDTRRTMDTSAWWAVLQKQSAEALRHKRPLPQPRRYNDGLSADPRWIGAAVLAFPLATSVSLATLAAPALAPALAVVRCWQHLRELVLDGGWDMQGQDLAALSGCNLLARLDVSGSKRLETLAHLQGLPRLTDIIARDCPELLGEVRGEGDSAPVPLVSVPSLEGIELQGCDKLGTLRLALPRVASLDLSGFSSLSALEGSLPGLLSLDLSYCSGLVAITPALFRACSSLVDLTARSCEALRSVSGLLSATSLKCVRLPCCPRLERLVDEDEMNPQGTVDGAALSSRKTSKSRSVKTIPARPHMHYLDLYGCSSLTDQAAWGLVEPLLAQGAAGFSRARAGSKPAAPQSLGVPYELLQAMGGLSAGTIGSIVDTWADKASVDAARKAQAAVEGSKEALQNAEAAREAAAAKRAAAEAAAEAAKAQVAGLKGAKAAKAQEGADAAAREAKAAAAEAAAAIEAAQAAQVEAEEAPERAKAAKLQFLYRFRCRESGRMLDLQGDRDGVDFRAISGATDDRGVAVVWPRSGDCERELQLKEIDPELMLQEAARTKLREAVELCRAKASCEASRERVRATLTEALERADGVLRGGAEDFALLRSCVAAGLVELLPELEVPCFLGSGVRVRAADYLTHEVGCSHLREQPRG
eukprot:TRINITY_DN26191_c0_g1_i1.p1 TRINITY_DN26191_c0_g1~~TRINITY_DN26191_c0_g1_i1.p1  ORF type:complete len:906 (-),score=221.87 TRINITY_DN26191_c0_g1_i1:54-2711(-)